MCKKRQVAESESESVSGVLFGERQDSIPLIPINVINSFFDYLIFLGDLSMDDFDLPRSLNIDGRSMHGNSDHILSSLLCAVLSA